MGGERLSRTTHPPHLVCSHEAIITFDLGMPAGLYSNPKPRPEPTGSENSTYRQEKENEKEKKKQEKFWGRAC